MKRIVSLLLATLMVVTILPVAAFVAMAEDAGAAATTTTYQVYKEDFDGLDENASSDDILEALGWYVPACNEAENIADYSVAVTKDGDAVVNKALHISTETLGIGGLSNRESFVTVFGGDVMSVVRNGNFVLSYDLTYRAGTVNADGYSAMIYNYNEQSGVSVTEGDAAIYGIVAVRACGTGFNNVYYPISGGSTMGVVELDQNAGEYVMSNRYSSTGSYASLYARIAGTQNAATGDMIDAEYSESDDAVLRGTARLIDKTLRVKIEYSYDDGIRVFVNDVLVSTTNVGYNLNEYANDGIWNDFVTRTDSAAIALLTKADVAVDIDNIEIVAEAIGNTDSANQLPELVITEMAPMGHKNGSTSYTWAEYIEIYNASDKPVDLADYAIMYCDVTNGDADAMVIGSNLKKYAGYQNFGDILGKPLVSKTKIYESISDLKTFDSTQKRYQFVDANTTLTTGAAYTKQLDGTWKRDDANGTHKYIQYVENWNARYVQGNSNYDNNTMLNPGECALIYTIQDNEGNKHCWKNGVNAGSDDPKYTSISGKTCFRNVYQSRGLTAKTKVFAMNAFNLADNTGTRRYYIGKANYDDQFNEDGSPVAIKYTSVNVTDAAHDKYVVSYVDWNSSVIAGVLYEDAGPNDTYFGQGGRPGSNTGEAAQYFSGVWVYGVNASGDYRCGTLYKSNQRINNGSAHVGILAGYQKLLMQDIFAKAKKSNGALADLMITEIVPGTTNLAGESYNAFSAVELTNTSSESLDLYRYALVSTKQDNVIGKNDKFSYSTIIQPGNPVKKGEGNGAYYYFVDNYISNPEECILAPGETVVIWFLTNDTYQAYARDEDFGFDYFRQYWVNQGNNQLAMKNADGGYATKVIAVDGNNSEVTNIDNSKRVFELSRNYSAVYGVATASTDVKRGTVKIQDVLSVAFLGASATYYNLEWKAVEHSTGTFYANVLTRTIPVNTGMRYLAGEGGNRFCSAMADSLTVQWWEFSTSGRSWYNDNNPGATPCVRIITNPGVMQPRLGTLDGAEVCAIRDHLFKAETDADGNTVYRYFDDLRTSVTTMAGAALKTGGSTPALRFDNAVSNSVYNSLIATYGKNVEIGMLIYETELAGDTEIKSEADLVNAGIPYSKVVGKVLYRTDEFTFISSSISVGAENYNTSYTAVGYMTVKLSASETLVYASAVSAETSVADVAEAALEDVRETKNDVYRYSDANGFYSRYNAEIQAKLRSYIGL